MEDLSMLDEVDPDVPPYSAIKVDWLTQQHLSEGDRARFLALIEELIGIPYRYSPEATSRALLMHLHNRTGGKRLELAEMPPPALIPGLEADLHWIRDLSKEEREAGFIVGYDVNAAYLAACSALPLGVGKPEHIGPNEGYAGVGYHRVARGWISTPTFLYELPSEHLETWIWRETSRPLEPWYKVLRDARMALLIRSDRWGHEQFIIRIALDCVKRMYTHFIGRLASTRWDRTGDVLYRPDWRHMIVATRRTRLQRIMAQCDPAPFAAFSDCLYFATTETVKGLKIGTNPGSFKLHGTERNEGDVAAAALAGDLNQLVNLVK